MALPKAELEAMSKVIVARVQTIEAQVDEVEKLIISGEVNAEYIVRVCFSTMTHRQINSAVRDHNRRGN